MVSRRARSRLLRCDGGARASGVAVTCERLGRALANSPSSDSALGYDLRHLALDDDGAADKMPSSYILINKKYNRTARRKRRNFELARMTVEHADGMIQEPTKVSLRRNILLTSEC